MKTNEEFEKWWSSEGWDKKLNYVQGVTFNRIKSSMFLSWQASRSTIEIELPSLRQIDTGERYQWSDGVSNFKEDAINVLRAAGIKVKE
ncbi:hypothetical protein E4898_13070 [Salmonella enterica subsp. enterica serovar Anatum]|uniref:Uncharacterized protein n=1 Tax=Salmonella anatum TaxID=58712 RepID=A0A5X1XIN9_SALAN|nr:hypothetical protein [Salmonella enterica]EAB9380250.1 hypothetical protein [Salmonella enterica subsp. enterica serovar Give]EAW1290070.1 hypothetical protein [Salmonella enterica subsp. enterica]EBG0394740.1 hypothetical protein [Salmonella enterica subsp. enterica serovar Muenster]ECI2721104.1 hypothetical protein [Salmonella enterica subsp. enterica serovar Richmond]EDR0867503.1 hypothetical protein [Salmonella enterica subsp. enterica serovar Orion]EDU8520319.1 hypothetical protein [S